MADAKLSYLASKIGEMSGLSLVNGEVVESTTNSARYVKQARRQAVREEQQVVRQAVKDEKQARRLEVEQLRIEEQQALAEQKAAEAKKAAAVCIGCRLITSKIP